MPWVQETYGGASPKRQPGAGWASQFSSESEEPEQQTQAGWASQFAEPIKPVSRGRKVEGVPYPVANEDAFGIPEGGRASFGTRFFEELPGAVRDLATSIGGPEGGPLSTPEQQQKFRETQDKVGSELIRGLQQAADKQHEYMVPRTIGQAAMQMSGTIQNMILRPLGWIGVEGAEDTAEKTNTILKMLAADDSKETAKSWLAQNVGEGVARGAESIINSVTQAALTGGASKGIMSAQKAMMFFFGAQSADQALTEAKEAGLTGSQRYGYAAGIGVLEGALMLAGGRIAKGLGLETTEEALFREVKPALQNLLSRTGVKEAMKQLPKAIAGSGIEASEEGLTQLSQTLWKAAYTGDDEGVTDRVVSALGQRKTWTEAGFAAAVGAGARASTGAAQQVASGMEAAVRQLPGIIQKAASRVAGAPSGSATTVDATAAPATPAAAPPTQAPIAQPTVAQPPVAQPSAPAAPAVPAATAEPPVVGAGLAPEEAPPEGPPMLPPSEREQVPEDAGPVAIKNAQMERLSREFGRRGNSAYSPEHREFRESARLAIEDGIPERALSLAMSVKENPRQLTDVETAGFNVRLMELRDQRRAASQAIARAAETSDQAQTAFQSAELERIGNEFDTIYDATIRAGTEQGRAFASRRWSLMDDDMDYLSKAGQLRASKGSDLTMEDRNMVEGFVERHNKTDAELTKAVENQDEQVVQKFIEKAKKTASSPDNVDALYTRLKELLANGCDLE